MVERITDDDIQSFAAYIRARESRKAADGPGYVRHPGEEERALPDPRRANPNLPIAVVINGFYDYGEDSYLTGNRFATRSAYRNPSYLKDAITDVQHKQGVTIQEYDYEGSYPITYRQVLPGETQDGGPVTAIVTVSLRQPLDGPEEPWVPVIDPRIEDQ